ncbi:MAG: DUF3089 domain-containing protein [Bacteroidia bacterium]|nr:DUF3089 domain-containing protein [Bacteroidia bacterium]
MSIRARYDIFKNGIKFFRQFRRQCRPNVNFTRSDIPPPYDYASLASWAAHPQKEHKANLTPPGYALPEETEADVFFVHPTSYFGKGKWNQPPGYNPAKEIIDEIIMPGQASVFNGACRIFAPYYRQATFYSFIALRKMNSRAAFVLAYEDILQAFDHYIEHENNGRPFVLASHSQGTLHMMRLLHERIENSDLRHRMIATYAIGFQFPRSQFGTKFKNIKICEGATDSGCVIAYDTFSFKGGPLHVIDRIEVWDGPGWKRRAHQAVVGVNPLSWSTTTELVNASENKGAVHIKYQGASYSFDDWFDNEKIGLNAIGLSDPLEAEVSAKLSEDGFLYITDPIHKIFRLAILPSHNYHNYDYSLFYMNLRQNVIDRVNAFTKKGATVE